MAEPTKPNSLEIIEDTVIRETTVVRPAPPPEHQSLGSWIQITAAEEPSNNVMTLDAGSVSVCATVSDDGARLQISSSDGGVARDVRSPPPPAPARTSSSTRFERKITILNGVETVEEYENGRLVKRMVNGAVQPLQ